MKLEYFTGKGRRNTNEDKVHIQNLNNEVPLILIVDGMGGYEKGDEAAEIVCTVISNFIENGKKISEEAIYESIQSANSAIKDFNEKKKIKSGATLGGVLVDENKAHLFWVGDVKIFYLRNKKVLYETKGHTLINDLKDNESISSGGSFDKYKHIVTRSISGHCENLIPDYKLLQIDKGDDVILCSDGIHDILNITQIINKLSKNKLEAYLLEWASDNYSLVNLNF